MQLHPIRANGLRRDVKLNAHWLVCRGNLHNAIDDARRLNRQLLPGEAEKVISWYERTIGWVPPWVRFYARFNPAALKGWRYRYENALVTLPQQVLPLSLLFGAARLEQTDAIRENVLMARAYGATIDDVIQTLGVTAVYGTEKVGAAYRAAGDILESWESSERSGQGG